MKYQYLILKELFFCKFWKWVLIYVLLVLINIYLIYQTVESKFFNPYDIEMLLGILPFSRLNILGILILLYQIFLTIYFVYSFCIYEYNHSSEFIFLRINHIKRNIFKIVLILLFIVFLRILYFAIIFLIFNKYYNFTFIIFLRNISYYLIITFITYSCICIRFLFFKN